MVSISGNLLWNTNHFFHIGDCSCSWPYGGPDCGIDLRIPPTIFDIEGGGVCDTGVGEECVCFTLRADNIFDGFMCDIKTYKVCML